MRKKCGRGNRSPGLPDTARECLLNSGGSIQGLKQCQENFKVAKAYANFDELIADKNVDAVHINSPIPDHAWMSVKALNAGKHVKIVVSGGFNVDKIRHFEERRVPVDIAPPVINASHGAT